MERQVSVPSRSSSPLNSGCLVDALAKARQPFQLRLGRGQPVKVVGGARRAAQASRRADRARPGAARSPTPTGRGPRPALARPAPARHHRGGPAGASQLSAARGSAVARRPLTAAWTSPGAAIGSCGREASRAAPGRSCGNVRPQELSSSNSTQGLHSLGAQPLFPQ